jgi:predicted dehydrogenase
MPGTRRRFLGAVTAASYARVLGANDRIQAGFIGYGLIGAQHVHDFKRQPDVDLAAVAEVSQTRLDEGLTACGPRAKGYRDFRKLLESPEIQAVVVSTPDHWHALMTILACAAGKDVYVEKPLTLFVREGRWMVTAARRYNRVVQVGTQQRSGRHYQKAVKLMRGGYIGKVHSVRMGSFRNVMPGFGAPADTAPPSGLDYDLWLGPAPARAYNPHRSLYHFRWFWDYSGGQMTNLAAHELDLVLWAMQVKGPTAVSSSGGRFCLEGNGETPDTQDALFEFPGFTALWSHREAGGARRRDRDYATEFVGSKGTLAITRGRFEVIPDPRIEPSQAIPVFKGHPAGGPARIEQKVEPWIQPLSEPGSQQEQFELHVRNFLDCVKSRERPIADVEEGHRVATACHLANISLLTGRKIRWDAEKEEIPGDAEAAARLERAYRKPWDEVLRSLKL